MLTLLNIGNTHTGIARWDGSELELLPSAVTAGFDPAALPPEVPVAAASVVPQLSAVLTAARPGTFLVSAASCSGLIDFSPVDASTLGADRIANAVAAAELYPLPAIVVDCGSAVTFEVVDARRRFQGGAIAPGRQLMRAALFHGTAQLPEGIALSPLPPELPGTNTAGAIAFGIDRGIIGMVKEMTEILCRQFSPRSLILTGGDAPFFAAALPGAVTAPADFTLRGVLYAALAAAPEA